MSWVVLMDLCSVLPLQTAQRCRCIVVWKIQQIVSSIVMHISPLFFWCEKNLPSYSFVLQLKKKNLCIMTGGSTVVCFAVAECRSKVETHLIGSEREVAFDPTHPLRPPSPRKLSPAPSQPWGNNTHGPRTGRQLSWTPGEAADGLLTRTPAYRSGSCSMRGEPAGDDRYSSTPVTMWSESW